MIYTLAEGHQRVQTAGRHVSLKLVIPCGCVVLGKPLAEFHKFAFAQFANGGLNLLDATHALILARLAG